jgi:hypothetical protein
MPRFQPPTLDANLRFVDALQALAAARWRWRSKHARTRTCCDPALGHVERRSRVREHGCAAVTRRRAVRDRSLLGGFPVAGEKYPPALAKFLDL